MSSDGSTAWVLVDDGAVRSFGPALAWASRAGAAELHVLVSDSSAAGVIARRAGELSVPPSVWEVDGRDLRAAVAAPYERFGAPVDPEVVALLLAHGAEPVVEQGVLRGEVLGLEVARVVDGRLEVGVGRHDRLARRAVGSDPGEALDEAVAVVSRWRRPDVPSHPANALARGRWLRAVVCAHPDLVGAERLSPVEPPLPWLALPEAGPAPCAGLALDGSEVVVVCSTGVDLDLVPTAADARRMHNGSASLVLVVPDGDDLPVTRSLAAALARPAEVRIVPRDWASLGG